MTKPAEGHQIRIQITPGWNINFALVCHWSQDDTSRPCWPEEEDGTPYPPGMGKTFGCGYSDWLEDLGIEGLKGDPIHLMFDVADTEFDGDLMYFELGRVHPLWLNKPFP